MKWFLLDTDKKSSLKEVEKVPSVHKSSIEYGQKEPVRCSVSPVVRHIKLFVEYTSYYTCYFLHVSHQRNKEYTAMGFEEDIFVSRYEGCEDIADGLIVAEYQEYLQRREAQRLSKGYYIIVSYLLSVTIVLLVHTCWVK